jgi:GrpB-like predicted nucleotidyltransferase (UPF0157 family)
MCLHVRVQSRERRKSESAMEDISTQLASARLGLKRGDVDLAVSAEWESAYAAIEPVVRSACGEYAIDVQHVGSTSVPGLRAKPILDVAIGVRPGDDVPEGMIDALVGLGFIDRGAGAGSIGRLLVWETEPGVRAVHLHIVGYGTRHWNDYVEFRDALRMDARLLADYEQVKDALAQQFSEDRSAYTSGKARFVEQALRRLSSN